MGLEDKREILDIMTIRLGQSTYVRGICLPKTPPTRAENVVYVLLIHSMARVHDVMLHSIATKKGMDLK